MIADGASTFQGELALGRNVLVGFMSFDGYNFEDAIVVSEKLVREDYFTSVHVDEYILEVRDTKRGLLTVAKPAIPVLLKMAVEQSPDDPRNVLQQRVALAWGCAGRR